MYGIIETRLDSFRRGMGYKKELLGLHGRCVGDHAIRELNFANRDKITQLGNLSHATRVQDLETHLKHNLSKDPNLKFY